MQCAMLTGATCNCRAIDSIAIPSFDRDTTALMLISKSFVFDVETSRGSLAKRTLSMTFRWNVGPSSAGLQLGGVVLELAIVRRRMAVCAASFVRWTLPSPTTINGALLGIASTTVHSLVD